MSVDPIGDFYFRRIFYLYIYFFYVANSLVRVIEKCQANENSIFFYQIYHLKLYVCNFVVSSYQSGIGWMDMFACGDHAIYFGLVHVANVIQDEN